MCASGGQLYCSAKCYLHQLAYVTLLPIIVLLCVDVYHVIPVFCTWHYWRFHQIIFCTPYLRVQFLLSM